MNDAQIELDAVPDAVVQASRETANDRFKRSFSAWFWSGIIGATAVHFAVFAFWPNMVPEDVGMTVTEIETIEIPPEVEIPPPPEAIARPATPVIAEVSIDQDITIEPTTFAENPVEDLPPPPEEVDTDISAAPVITPMDVRPSLKNRDEVLRVLEREYPPLLRDAGIGGTVVVWFFIDEKGVVQNALVQTSSGHVAFDDTAVRVARVFEYTPAIARDKAIPVWVTFPVTFTPR